MGVSFIARGGASANVTLGQTSFLGSAVTVLTFILGNDGLNTLDLSTLSGSAQQINITGSTAEELDIIGANCPIDLSAASLSGMLLLLNCSALPSPVLGITSYAASGTTSTTAFPALLAVCPATFDLHGLTPTKIQSINWGSVTSFSGATVSIDISGQALTSAESSEVVQVAATAGAGNLATMTVNVSGGTNGALLRPVTDLTVSLGGVNYEANDEVFVDAIQVGVVNSVGGLGDIIDFTLNSPNAFTNTSGTVTVTSTSGAGAAITVNTLGTNTYAATIVGAGGTVTSN